MILLKRNGKRYEVNESDQLRILELALENGGDISMAIAEFHKEKFGESFEEIRGESCESKR